MRKTARKEGPRMKKGTKNTSWIQAARIVLSIIILPVFAVWYILTYLGKTGFHLTGKPGKKQIRVACVGDSITYGYGIRGWFRNQYPMVLARKLGSRYHVQNFGLNGANVQVDSDKPYGDEKIYQQSLSYEPDILVFMMGSNDAKPQNWHGRETFKADLTLLLDSYYMQGKQPTIYLCTPATAFPMKNSIDGISNFDIQPAVVSEIAEVVAEVAKENRYHLIDIHTLTADHPEWFPDSVHPNKKGAAAIARIIFDAMS